MTFDVTLKPWPQTEADFRAGRLDLVAMVNTAERRNWARFTRGHATPVLAVYQRQDRGDAHGLTDLMGLRIAVLDGDAMRDTLAHWLATVPGPFVRLADASQALTAVQQGQADVALLPRAYADPLLAAGAARGIKASRLNLPLQTYALAMATGNEALQARLQQGLDRLEANGRLEALRVRWLSSHRDLAERALAEHGLSRQRQWTWGLGGASAAALLLMGASLWQRSRRIAAERQRRLDAEASLQRAEGLLERAFTHHPDAMLIVERGSGVMSDANDALLSLLGVTADDLVGQTIDSLQQHVDASALEQVVQLLEGDGALDAVPLRVQRADGAERDCLVSADRIAIDGAAHVFCIVRDITEQLAHDAALRLGYDALSAELAQSRRELDAAREGRARAEGSLQEFTRTVAHDLKSPLNAVTGFAGLLRERLAGRPRAGSVGLHRAHRRARRNAWAR